MQAKPLAVLIDAENIAAVHYPLLCTIVETLGRPIIFRIFGDFSAPTLSPWLALAKQHSLETEMQVSGGKGKNSTDMLMAIHAMDILHDGMVKGICLVSSDRDFAPLATRLKASHLMVWGFGNSAGDASLRKACDEYFLLDHKPKSQNSQKSRDVQKPAPVQVEVAQIVSAMKKIIADNGENGGIGLSAAAAALRQNYPVVADKVCGKGKFLKNLRATERFKEQGDGVAIKIFLKAS